MSVRTFKPGDADPPAFDLDDAGDLYWLAADGRRPVRAARSFPWSAPDRFVVFKDRQGQELLAVDDLSSLPAGSRGVVEAWFQRHSFVPKIVRVRRVREGNAVLLFHVETDRGEKRLRIREREDLRPLADGRTLVRDTDGVTFELPPLADLDTESRRELAMVL